MVVTYDGNTLSYYIDGALGSYSGLSPTITDPGLNLSTLTRIGINGGSPWPDNSINGSTLDFRIYGQALTPPQVASIYALGADASNSAISAVLANAAASSPAQLLHRYNFSTDASDSVGANNGTLLNGAGFSTGKVGLGMHFNGHSQCVSVPNSSSLHAANYSVEAWVEPLAPIPAAIGQTLIFGQNGGVSQLVLRPGSTGVRVVWQFARGDGSFPEVDSTTEIPIGQFSHLAGTWDGTTLKLFIDGVLNAQSTPGATPWDSGCEFFIGGFYDNTSSRCRYVGEFFVGTIDELSVYNRALSSNEIAAIYAAGRAGKCTTVSPPVILTEPFSQTNNVGTDASFSVLALGTAPLGYQWSKDGTTIPGGTNATLVLTSVQKTDQGYYSVVVSNPYGTATNSSAFLYVNRPPVADASATLTVVISSDGISAALLLDGTRSSDPDGDPLRYEWYEAGNASLLANGAVADVLLPVGSHSLLLVVSDGLAQATNAFPVEVITTAQAVAQLAAAVNTSVPRSQSLQATLSAAQESIARGNVISAINQLNSFQNQVRAQLSRQDLATAAALIQAAQEVIEVLSGGNTNPGDRRHGAVTGVNRQVKGQ
jgi:hypothetical protein